MFEFLGALGGVLPGYQQGQQQAVSDNWSDLLKYNQAQAGQLQNAFDEFVMPFRRNIFQDQAVLSDINKRQAGMALSQAAMLHPGIMERNIRRAQMMPTIEEQKTAAILRLLEGMDNTGGALPGIAPLNILYPEGTY